MSAPGKTLIVTHNFIPYCVNIGSALRVLKLADFLADRGVVTHVLAARGMDMGTFGYGGVLDKVNASYVMDPFQYASTLALSRGAKARRSAQPRTPVPRRLVPALGAFLKEISVPDPVIYAVPLFAARALQLVRKHGIRNVVVSSPPHSMQVAGWLVKLALKDMVNLVVDYRDTWNTTSIFRKRTLPFQALNAFLEARALAACDRFVYCTPPMLDKVNRRFFDVTHKARLVMNGFEAPEGFARAAPPATDVLTIGYFGALNESEKGFRNPGLFFRALEKLQRPVRLVFYGSISISPAWSERFPLEIHGAIPHGEALKRMQAMDALLLLHSEREGADEVITGKFFDYVLAGRPILSVGPADMEASRLVREHGLGYAMDLYDPEDMLRTMERVLADRDAGNLPAPRRDDFLHFSRERQYEGFLDVLV
jgi:glycosyltransferase involved in cell wall biosynthesis